jgi:small-conductance mechanosensitive channel
VGLRGTISERAARLWCSVGFGNMHAMNIALGAGVGQSMLQVVLATAAFVLVLAGLLRVRRALLRVAAARARSAIDRVGLSVLKPSQVHGTIRRLLDVVAWGLALLAAYSWLAFVLTRFPETEAAGSTLDSYLWDTVRRLGLGAVQAVPGLVTVALVFVGTRFLTRIVAAFFQSVEAGDVDVPGLHADTAQPTRRIATALLWLFALVAAYPYLPGSDSDAFKGVSVLAGLMLSLGSSGLVNQAMSGLVLMYARALRLGDYVRIGDVEGTVTEVGMLSTKVRTTKREEVTIPNALLVSQVTQNFSRLEAEVGVIVHTTVTIGYDTPWRQVHALLELAASRTAGIRRDPRPFVLQLGLADFYPQYQLNVHLERSHDRIPVLSALHANIQDAFNEHGVQIMSPNYRGDPATPKLVPPGEWRRAPAPPDGP